MPDIQDDTGSPSQVKQPGFNSSNSSIRTRLTLGEAAKHGLAGDVVDAIEPQSEADPVALLMHFLTMIGNVVGDGLYVQLGPDKHPGRLYSIIVGDAAMGRKGTAGSEIKRLMAEVDDKWYTGALLSGMRSAESIVSVVDDDSGQGSQLMLYYSEFGDLLSTMKKQNNISDILKDAYDGSPLTIRTKNRRGWLTATHAHISMMGHVTPTILTDRLADSDIASGLASRLLFAKVERSKEISRPRPMDVRKFEALVNKVHEVLEWAKEFAIEGVDPVSATLYRELGRNPKQEIHLTDDAWDYWDVLYHELGIKRPGILSELVVRAPTNVMRLALIYAILDKSPVIDVVHLNAAKAVWDYSEASASEIFAGITGDYRVDKILVELSTSPNNTLTQSEIHAMFGRHLSAARIKAIIKSLMETNMVDRVTKQPAGGRGRPLTTYTLRIDEFDEKNASAEADDSIEEEDKDEDRERTATN